jgi:protein-disulfide isomerase
MSKRKEMREKRRQQQRNRRLITIGLVVVGALLVALALIYPNLKPVGAIKTPAPTEHPMAEGNAMGDPNAPVKIVEYSDFQCPYCAQFHQQTEPQIIENYVRTGKVYFVYRSMGNFIGDNLEKYNGISDTESRDAAEAAYCAGDQNKFWEYHDILFTNHTGEGAGDFTSRRLLAFAEAIGLDMNQFRTCISNATYRQRVLQDETDGNAAGVTGTPAFVLSYTVNGQTKTQLISGAQPFSTFQQDIDSALSEMGVK